MDESQFDALMDAMSSFDERLKKIERDLSFILRSLADGELDFEMTDIDE